jgi:hypothetical protein
LLADLQTASSAAPITDIFDGPVRGSSLGGGSSEESEEHSEESSEE